MKIRSQDKATWENFTVVDKKQGRDWSKITISDLVSLWEKLDCENKQTCDRDDREKIIEEK